jgi:heterodisulfide reductase subunit A
LFIDSSFENPGTPPYWIWQDNRVKLRNSFFQGATMETQPSQKTNGSVMVVGGGIAGMQAALDLADSGFYVHLVEKSPAIGGLMSQLDKTFPTNDCAM